MDPVPRSSMKLYQLTSMDVSPSAATHLKPKPDWMRHMTPRQRMRPLARAIRSSSQTLRHPTQKRPATVTKSATKRSAQETPSFPATPKVKKQKQAVPTPAPPGSTLKSSKQAKYRWLPREVSGGASLTRPSRYLQRRLRSCKSAGEVERKVACRI